MHNPVLTYYYLNNVKLTTKTKTFLESVKFILERQEPTLFTPYKLVVESTGKIFYFKEDCFKAYINLEISITELQQATQCKGLYRNKETIVYENIEIDPDTLFILKEDRFILADADHYFSILAPDNNFYEI